MLKVSTKPDNRPEPLLSARALSCRRGGRLLFDALDLEVEAGRIVWLRGANGSGKTSLLRLLAGLAKPDAGAVRCGVARLYLAHANGLKDDLTAHEALAFLARLHGGDAAPASLRGALARFGLRERADAPIRALSQGQRRRVALARLALEPTAPLWLLDEPFEALDAEGSATLGAALRRQAERGGAAVLSSHQPLAVSGTRARVFEFDQAAA